MLTAGYRLFIASAILAGGFATPVVADDSRDNPATRPINRDNARHKQLLKMVAGGKGNVIFLGDSITERWENTGRRVWMETFAPLGAVNLGVGGDQIGHVLWRITEGKELAPLQPKVAVLLIGTNNIGVHRPEQIAGGVKAIIEELRRQKPRVKVLLLGLFPRSTGRPDKTVTRISRAELLATVKQVNALLAKLDDGTQVFYKDIGKNFLTADGGLTREVMSDYLHLGPRGYRIWADAIQDDVKKLLESGQ